MYSAFITRIKNVRKHSNADRLLCGECFGNTVIVGLDTKPDELGVYFPVDGKLGLEFAQKHDLLRRKDENGKPAGGYLDPEKRNIKALTLRGEKSDGLFMPLSSLEDFTDISTLREGDTITVLNGITICEKYIPRSDSRGGIRLVIALVSVKIQSLHSLWNTLIQNSFPTIFPHSITEIRLKSLSKCTEHLREQVISPHSLGTRELSWTSS